MQEYYMKRIYRFLSLVMAFFVLFTVVPPLKVTAAEYKRYSLSDITPDMFTSSEVLIDGLNKVLTEYPVAFTKSGEVCSKSHTGGESNCLWFTPHQNYEKHSSRAIQCFGYANYVYETIFGQYWDHEQYFSDDGTLGSMNTGAKARSEFERLGVSFGTIMRSYSAGHSFVILDWDEEGVWIIHANYAGSRYGGCNTSVYYYTWDGFSDAYDKVGYIIIPASICEKCVYTEESFPVCTVCEHRLKITDNIYANYTVTTDSNEYFLPLEGMVSEEIITAGTDLIITSVFDVNSVTFARTEDGRYVECGKLEFTGYLPSMEVKNAEYPDEYIVSGKSFWLDGKVVSKNAVTSLTLEILNSDGNIIDENTITPNRLSVSIGDADNLQFSKLKKGYYTFRLTASDLAEEGKVLIESPFRVISSKTVKDAFGDKIFRQYLLSEILKDATEKDYVDLYDEVLSKVSTIDITDKGISSLGEIGRFTGLTTLLASHNHIKAIDLSNNTALTDCDLSDQSVVITGEYIYSSAIIKARLDDENVFTYSRPAVFPKEETLMLPSGFGDMEYELNVTVEVNKRSACDINGDGVINSDDLSMVLASYGRNCLTHEDLTFDGKVDAEDISLIITYFGK